MAVVQRGFSSRSNSEVCQISGSITILQSLSSWWVNWWWRCNNLLHNSTNNIFDGFTAVRGCWICKISTAIHPAISWQCSVKFRASDITVGSKVYQNTTITTHTQQTTHLAGLRRWVVDGFAIVSQQSTCNGVSEEVGKLSHLRLHLQLLLVCKTNTTINNFVSCQLIQIKLN